MLAQGIEVSHESIRLRTLRFGTEYARRLRRRRGACSNSWHLDELCLMVNGERSWLWRAVDDAGEVLDILVQRRRSALAAKRFFRKLLKGLRMVPCAIVTDRLATCANAGLNSRIVLLGVEIWVAVPPSPRATYRRIWCFSPRRPAVVKCAMVSPTRLRDVFT
jgi:putative transposase